MYGRQSGMWEACVRVRVFFIWDYVGPVLIIFFAT